jgi:hypothetical protein
MAAMNPEARRNAKFHSARDKQQGNNARGFRLNPNFEQKETKGTKRHGAGF